MTYGECTSLSLRHTRSALLPAAALGDRLVEAFITARMGMRRDRGSWRRARHMAWRGMAWHGTAKHKARQNPLHTLS